MTIAIDTDVLAVRRNKDAFGRLPNILYHADWGSKPEKRWLAKAIVEAG